MTDVPTELVVPGPDELVLLEGTAVDVALEAGALVLNRPADLAVAATKSTRTDVVTSMDHAAQDLIRDRLSVLRPDDAFLGEEQGGVAEGASTITWVVDPIDGTVNYLYDLPAYAVSVAAVIGDPTQAGGWRPVAGAVVGPASREVYRARLGGGAHYSRRPDGAPTKQLRAGGCIELAQALVGTGFGYHADRRRAQARVLVEVLPEIRDIRRFGSAALDLCHVADGTLDGYWEQGLNPWDLAAGWLIVTEAGGRASTVPTSDLMWAAAPGIAAELAALVDRGLAAAAAASR